MTYYFCVYMGSIGPQTSFLHTSEKEMYDKLKDFKILKPYSIEVK